MEPNPTFSEEALQAFARQQGASEDKSGSAVESSALDPRISRELQTLNSMGRRVEVLFHAMLEDSVAVRSALDSLGLAGPRDDEAARAELERLKQFAGAEDRYEVEEEIARGGMSTVWRVRDRALDRTLALKVASPRAGVLSRFLAEARLTGALEHPGIVPVHDLGSDADGHARFAMPLVRGRTFTEVIDLARNGAGSWTTSRVLEVLLKACDTVEYAHSLGVVHRDLKPDNILVGRFGEVYVLDWGLARRTDASDEPSHELLSVDADLPHQHTQAGAVLGTPAYMAPEQAEGRNADLGVRADVYAMGAILYRFLSGSAPYCEGAEPPSSRAVLTAVLRGPPTEIESLDPAADAELAAICRKAMQREVSARYATVAELSADVRAYIEGHVVGAHAGGAWAQLRKWVGRNRRLAAASALALLILIAGLAAVRWSEKRRVAQLERSSSEIRFESDQRAPAALRASAQALWPAVPARIPDFEAWVREAQDLLSRRAWYERELRELRRSETSVAAALAPGVAAGPVRELAEIDELRSEAAGHAEDIVEMEQRAAEPGRSQGLAYAYTRIDRLSHRVDVLEARLASTRSSTLADPDLDRRRTDVEDLIDAIDDLSDPVDGLIADVEARWDLARSLSDSAALAADPAWLEAIEDIADSARSPLYGGLRIRPQVGLAPLRRNPSSGLWEFHVIPSGIRPRMLADGSYQIGPRTGIVLVLVPGGLTRIGARALEPAPASLQLEGGGLAGPLRTVSLDPYFLSKYEMTQGQWLNATGRNPAYFHAGTTFEWPGRTVTFDLSYPVESVSWMDSQQVLAQLGLLLPTEARLEHAYRAGTEGPWSLPDAPWCLISGINAMHDKGAPSRVDFAEGYLPDDGFDVASPVGWFPANPWGLHEVHGNVGEWALDLFWSRYLYPLRPGDGLHMAPESSLRVVRSGTWGHPIQQLRSYSRDDKPLDFKERSVGVRPARVLDLQ